MIDPITFEIAKMTGCAVCASPVIYLGPAVLANGERFCSEVCSVIDVVRSPGRWISADELGQGGELFNRPELWFDD